MTQPLSARVPDSSSLLAAAARSLFRLFGWQPEGHLPDLPKVIVVSAPHTSNWDGVILLWMSLILRVRLRYLVKHTLMRPPLGWLVRATGGVPIDRTAKHNAVEQAVQMFNATDRMALAISPEGTRKPVEYWKTGFYYIALGAGVPLALGYIDYARRRSGIGPIIVPSGDLEADMAQIRAFYAPIVGRHPSRMSETRTRPQPVTPEGDSSHE
jgi:1-acyl-sn-glycerol-3-phosphate acyltransferase